MSAFLAARDRTSDSYDAEAGTPSKIRYISQKSEHDITGEVVSCGIYESANPKNPKGTENFICKIRVLDFENGFFTEKGSSAETPLEEGMILSILKQFNPGHSEYRQNNELEDAAEVVAAAAGVLPDVYLDPEGGPTKMMEVLEDDGAAIQGAKILVKSVQNGDWHNSKCYPVED